MSNTFNATIVATTTAKGSQVKYALTMHDGSYFDTDAEGNDSLRPVGSVASNATPLADFLSDIKHTMIGEPVLTTKTLVRGTEVMTFLVNVEAQEVAPVTQGETPAEVAEVTETEVAAEGQVEDEKAPTKRTSRKSA